MKQGQSLQDLAAVLQRTRDPEYKKDFVAPEKQLQMGLRPTLVQAADGRTALRVVLDLGDHGEYGVNPVAHSQLSARLQIPKPYYDRMLSTAPALLAGNVNHWLSTSEEARMVRTLGGTARAYLSDRYRPLDNVDLAEATFQTMVERQMEVNSCAVTDERLYIKAVMPQLRAEVRLGDVVEMGIMISNSEVGLGSVQVKPMIHRLICLNGAVIDDLKFMRYHVGRSTRGAGDEGPAIEQFFTDATRQADDRAFFLKVRDVVAGVLTSGVFDRQVEKMKAAAEHRLPAKTVDKVVEVTARKLDLTEGERKSVLEHLLEGGDLTQYGLMNAVTRASQDVSSYDRASQLENLGGRIIELSPTDWREIAEAA